MPPAQYTCFPLPLMPWASLEISECLDIKGSSTSMASLISASNLASPHPAAEHDIQIRSLLAHQPGPPASGYLPTVKFDP